MFFPQWKAALLGGGSICNKKRIIARLKIAPGSLEAPLAVGMEAPTAGAAWEGGARIDTAPKIRMMKELLTSMGVEEADPKARRLPPFRKSPDPPALETQSLCGARFPPRSCELRGGALPFSPPWSLGVGERGGHSTSLASSRPAPALTQPSCRVRRFFVQVAQLLLEFLHKYVAEVVSDAAVYQEHAGKPEIDIDDLRLAIQVLYECGAVLAPGM